VTSGARKPAEKKSVVRCPICGKPTAPAHRPFCSKRCAEVDLGRWLKGGYAVPGQPVAKIDGELGKSDDELA
jgi:endogenous inhibitor of DNA gyrase (YacG/DUF329 family)